MCAYAKVILAVHAGINWFRGQNVYAILREA